MRESITSAFEHEDWEAPSENDQAIMISSYRNGFKDALNKIQKSFDEALKDGAKRSANLAYELQGFLNKKEYSLKDIYLNIIDPLNYKLIAFIGEDETLRDDILDVYSFIGRLETRHNDIINVSFSVLEEFEGFDHDDIASDGYILKLK